MSDNENWHFKKNPENSTLAGFEVTQEEWKGYAERFFGKDEGIVADILEEITLAQDIPVNHKFALIYEVGATVGRQMIINEINKQTEAAALAMMAEQASKQAANGEVL